VLSYNLSIPRKICLRLLHYWIFTRNKPSSTTRGCPTILVCLVDNDIALRTKLNSHTLESKGKSGSPQRSSIILQRVNIGGMYVDNICFGRAKIQPAKAKSQKPRYQFQVTPLSLCLVIVMGYYHYLLGYYHYLLRYYHHLLGALALLLLGT